MKAQKSRIMVVDDEVSFTRLLKMNLENLGHYEVQTVTSSDGAVAAARKFKPDLILLDVMMPGLDGGDLAGPIKRNPKLDKTPIVFLTAAVKREEMQAHNGMIGGLPFIAKPVDIRELEGVIEKHLGAASEGAR